jgi:thymidylate synthase (FAD)|tara:strand:- start:596 stop:1261 length:666 start_codon:yes stop_codon:yes gene_type:complete
MKVRLISHTQPDNIIGVDDAQELIAYCARVSNPGNQNNKETSDKLIKYLIKHKHWSPLEMVNACIEIETTRDIARQILRHRSFSFQEFSQRYADPTKDLTYETKDARFQDTTNRQNSIDFDPTDEPQRRLNENFRMQQMKIWWAAKKTYEWAIENGIAKEQARAVLPEGMTVSRLYMNGTLRSWVHYIDLRSANGTQKEHQAIAVACAKEIATIFPLMKEL